MKVDRLPSTWVFWSHEQTPHLSDVIKHVATEERRCIWVAETGLTHERQKLGFRPPDLGTVESVVTPDPAQMKLIAQRSPSDTVHVFYGIRGFALNRAAFLVAAKAGASIAIVTENRNQPGWRSALRNLTYRADTPLIRRYVKCVFVNGYLGKRGGRRFYKGLGWPASRLFPFGYFAAARGKVAVDPRLGPFRIVYVGQLIPRKGVDILLRAMSLVDESLWELHLVGNGPEQTELLRLCTELKITDRVFFSGPVPLNGIPDKICDFDLLILPSRFDGWGMVVNEALSSGLPVICSDTCGAQDLLRNETLGQTFLSEDPKHLADTVSQRMKAPRETRIDREARRHWYNDHATAKVAAQYMLDSVESAMGKGSRPVPPWLRGSDDH